MDSNSNSLDNMCFPKIEMDSECEIFTYKRENRCNWNSENTMKLIDAMEKDCKELWDVKHPCNRDRFARQTKMEYLASLFDTSAEEISRKIHNLRSQFNSELRKIKRRIANEGGLVAGTSGWEYFDALSFLLRAPSDPLDCEEGVNLALAEFQADEEVEFGIGVRADLKNPPASPPPAPAPGPVPPPKRVAASWPNPLPPMLWNEEPLPRVRPDANPDECQVFGDFVASELRTLRSKDLRRKLKRMIQKAILLVGDEEDVNIVRR